MRVGDSEMSDFEALLRTTGWGAYYKFLLGIACACAITENGALLTLPFTLPIAACDLKFSEIYLPYFYLSFTCGMALGGKLLSSMSDLIGRKAIIHLSLVLSCISLLGCAFSHEWIMLTICVFILGCGVASNTNIIRILFSECLTTERRLNMLIYVDLAGSLGYVVFSVINWSITPFTVDFNKEGFRFCTFRIIFALPALPIIIIACVTALLLPSPRYLLLREKYEWAIRVLQQIYTTNNDKLQEGLKLQIQDVRNCINDYGVNVFPEPHNCSEQIIYTVKKLVKSTGIIAKGNFTKVLIALILLNLLTFPGIFEMNLWTARVLSNDGDCQLEGDEMIYFENAFTNKCKFNTGLSIYYNFLLMSLNVILGKLLLLVLISYFPRRILLVILYVFCGSSCYLFVISQPLYVVKYITASIVLILYSSIETILMIITIETFPTAIRGLVAGYVKCSPYLARGIILFLLKSSCEMLPIIIGIMMLVGSVFVCFLREMRGLPMVE